jgi:hypothetical protein
LAALTLHDPIGAASDEGMHGPLINGLNTNETMAELLLETFPCGLPIRREPPC